MDGKSLDLTAEKIAQLRSLFPEVVAEDKIDFDRLKDILGANLAFPGEHYELSWAGKAEARKEIQKQTTATLVPEKANSVNFDATENIFIEGENLQVLRVLQRSYFGKVKMIYIDPPYNTGNDSFVYPDDYAERLVDYQKRAGITDEEGYLNKQDLWHKNTRESGQFHSVWLSMIYPRLYLARNLLRDDGVIFVSIDDNEAANLKLIMDEVFGPENFVAQVVWHKKRGKDNSADFFSKVHDYIFCYARNIKELKFRRLPLDEGTKKAYKNPDGDKRGDYRLLGLWSRGGQGGSRYEYTTSAGYHFTEREWLVGLETMKDLDADKRLVRVGDNLYRKLFIWENEGSVPETIWLDASNNANAADELKALFSSEPPFDTPKPTPLIIKMLGISTDNDSVVLDFFAGSGTTAQAVLELNGNDKGNRKFILVQLAEKLDPQDKSQKVAYDFCVANNLPPNIAAIGRFRVQKVIERMQAARAEKLPEGDLPPLGFQSYKLTSSNFKAWRSDAEGEQEILQQLELHQAAEKDTSTAENMLYELLLKAGLPLTTKIETVTVGGQNVFLLADGRLLVFFDTFTPALKEFIHARTPKRVVCLDRAFNGNDQALTNFQHELQDSEIELTVL